MLIVQKSFYLVLFLIASLSFSDIMAQDFKVIKRSRPELCENSKGCRFEMAEIEAKANKKVAVVYYLEKEDGSWEKHTTQHKGSGRIPMQHEGCDLTGRYMHFAYYPEEGVKEPSIEELKMRYGYVLRDK
ncbi:MAG: hypothetical protein JJT94_09025 [Bernardetiaceae bacterium]|nr:hypothetical protein [Bernardetiaceae bacterium]